MGAFDFSPAGLGADGFGAPGLGAADFAAFPPAASRGLSAFSAEALALGAGVAAAGPGLGPETGAPPLWVRGAVCWAGDACADVQPSPGASLLSGAGAREGLWESAASAFSASGAAARSPDLAALACEAGFLADFFFFSTSSG